MHGDFATAVQKIVALGFNAMKLPLSFTILAVSQPCNMSSDNSHSQLSPCLSIHCCAGRQHSAWRLCHCRAVDHRAGLQHCEAAFSFPVLTNFQPGNVSIAQ